MLKRTTTAGLLGLLVALVSPCGQANNGMYLTGYGFESVMMGGADVALARDAFAANNNPAGMTQLTGKALDLLGVVYYVPSAGHSDIFGNQDKPFTKNQKGLYGSGAYAQHIDNSPFSAGASLTVQGGVGWVFSGMNTQFGTRDDISSLFTVVRLAPAMAWKVNDEVSLGAGIGINYVSATQELFPNTSTPPSGGFPDGFSGFRFKDAGGTAITTKLGLQYHPGGNVTIGLTYGNQSPVPIKNGTLRLNLGNVGLGVVRYDQAKLTGFRLPEEMTVGIAFRPTSSLLISLQDRWYNWSKALGTLQIVATGPRVGPAPPSVTIAAPVDFRDQHVIQLGLAYDYDKDNTVYAGINHGPRPIPEQNMSPIFQPIMARHYMVGVMHRIDAAWQAAGGVEIMMPQTVTYDSVLFGPRAYETGCNLAFHMALSRRW